MVKDVATWNIQNRTYEESSESVSLPHFAAEMSRKRKSDVSTATERWNEGFGRITAMPAGCGTRISTGTLWAGCKIGLVLNGQSVQNVVHFFFSNAIIWDIIMTKWHHEYMFLSPNGLVRQTLDTFLYVPRRLKDDTGGLLWMEAVLRSPLNPKVEGLKRSDAVPLGGAATTPST